MPFLTHNELKITERALPLERLGQSFHDFKIVQLSDLHFYEYTDRGYYQHVVDTVNAMQPDVIALTGDVVHYGDRYINLAASYLKQLRARHVMLSVIGNHDYQDFARSANIEAMLGDCNFKVLRNANHCVKAESGERLWFAGLDDLWYGAPDIAKSLDGIDSVDEPVVMLAHNPLLFDPVAYYPKRRIDLILAGHTHGGHVYIPFLLPVYLKVFRMKYRYGLFEKNNTRLHVTSGLGSAAFYLKKKQWGLPRFRFNTNPEIAVLTLRASG